MLCFFMADADLSFLAICLLLLLLLFLKIIVRPRSVKIPIKSRHVFITGGSRGIGLALARQSVVEGGDVYLNTLLSFISNLRPSYVSRFLRSCVAGELWDVTMSIWHPSVGVHPSHLLVIGALLRM